MYAYSGRYSEMTKSFIKFIVFVVYPCNLVLNQKINCLEPGNKSGRIDRQTLNNRIPILFVRIYH